MCPRSPPVQQYGKCREDCQTKQTVTDRWTSYISGQGCIAVSFDAMESETFEMTCVEQIPVFVTETSAVLVLLLEALRDFAEEREKVPRQLIRTLPVPFRASASEPLYLSVSMRSVNLLLIHAHR